MRYFVIFLGILLAMAVCYAYYHDPAGCQKVLEDSYAVIRKVSPIALPPEAAQPVEAAHQNAASGYISIPAPAAHPMKLWAPPEVMPAEPNWTWTTSDGKTYQNVVVNKIEPGGVMISSFLGDATVDIGMLPPDIQKRLNYDPDAAACVGLKTYRPAELTDARSIAWKLHRPLAWVASFPGSLEANLDSIGDPSLKSTVELTQMTVSHLKPQAVVIWVESPADFDALPAPIHEQFFASDDDGLNRPTNKLAAPKIVISGADGTKVFGRVCHDQLDAARERSIDELFATIPQDAVIPTPAEEQLASTPAPSVSSPATPASTPPSAPTTPAASSAASPIVIANPTTSSVPVPNALPASTKPWAPPDVMPAQANWTWSTADGKTYQDVVVTKIEPDTVSITHSMGVAHIQISLLPPDIQKQLNYDPRAASQFTTLIEGKLTSADGTVAGTPDSSVQYFAVYYSAQWCPPCHAFSPRLVKWYNAFKPSHPNFELIFVSEDHDETAMFNYMKEMSMPWPAVRFSELSHDGHGSFRGSGIEKFAGDGIPDLVLVDASGKVLSDSYQNGTYVGPATVVDDINKLVGGTTPVPLTKQNPVAPNSVTAITAR